MPSWLLEALSGCRARIIYSESVNDLLLIRLSLLSPELMLVALLFVCLFILLTTVVGHITVLPTSCILVRISSVSSLAISAFTLHRQTICGDLCVSVCPDERECYWSRQSADFFIFLKWDSMRRVFFSTDPC